MDTLSQGLWPSRIDLAREADFTVGRLTVRPSKREVEADGVRRVLQPRVMQVLVALAQSKSGIVSQHELVVRCWSGLSVGDDAIARCIAQLRRLATGWDEAPFTIQTIAGVGYGLAQMRAPGVAGAAPKPILAVLPFSNLSDDPDQDYFAAGVVDELVVSLSRFKAFHVVSAAAGIISNDQSLTPTAAARELGARYLLGGSIRKAGDSLRIVVHLVEGGSGASIWSHRFEGALSEVFALQDRVAEEVAGATEIQVQEDGVAVASTRPTSNLNSYDLHLRSLPLFRQSRKDEMLESIDLLERAISLDPSFALALGQSSVCHRQIVDHEWSDDVELFRRRGRVYAERALALAPDDARAVVMAAGGLSGLEPTMDRALALTDRAIALNPASPLVWLISGSLWARAGQPERASEYLERSIRLDPVSAMGAFGRMYLAVCRFEQRRFEEALALFASTSRRMPISHAILAALYGHLGRTGEAQAALTMFDSLAAGTPERFSRLWFPQEDHRRLFLDGIELARRS
jgi:TolB-like protein/DNA-binding winged helix-turn-helix (wHTH) protein/Tfp pilus assembly protein PilF